MLYVCHWRDEIEILLTDQFGQLVQSGGGLKQSANKTDCETKHASSGA
jgi:hypothetical protein